MLFVSESVRAFYDVPQILGAMNRLSQTEKIIADDKKFIDYYGAIYSTLGGIGLPAAGHVLQLLFESYSKSLIELTNKLTQNKQKLAKAYETITNNPNLRFAHIEMTYKRYVAANGDIVYFPDTLTVLTYI